MNYQWKWNSNVVHNFAASGASKRPWDSGDSHSACLLMNSEVGYKCGYWWWDNIFFYPWIRSSCQDQSHPDLDQDSYRSLLMMAQLMFTSINNSIHGQQQNKTTNDTQWISRLNEWRHNIRNSIFSCICGAAATITTITTHQSNKYDNWQHSMIIFNCPTINRMVILISVPNQNVPGSRFDRWACTFWAGLKVKIFPCRHWNLKLGHSNLKMSRAPSEKIFTVF
jgi:hypothetical protein